MKVVVPCCRRRLACAVLPAPLDLELDLASQFILSNSDSFSLCPL